MNVSRDLFKGSNIETYIVVSCETVVRSSTDLTCVIVGHRVPEVASASGGGLGPSNPASTGCPGSLFKIRLKNCSWPRLCPGIAAVSVSINRLA